MGQRCGGAVPLPSIAVPGGGGPFEDSGLALPQGEIAVGLELMISLAQWAEVARGGAPTAGRMRHVIRFGVVELAVLGLVTAPRTYALLIAGSHMIGDGLGGAISRMPHIQHGSGQWIGDDPAPDTARSQGASHCRTDRSVACQFGHLSVSELLSGTRRGPRHLVVRPGTPHRPRHLSVRFGRTRTVCTAFGCRACAILRLICAPWNAGGTTRAGRGARNPQFWHRSLVARPTALRARIRSRRQELIEGKSDVDTRSATARSRQGTPLVRVAEMTRDQRPMGYSGERVEAQLVGTAPITGRLGGFRAGMQCGVECKHIPGRTLDPHGCDSVRLGFRPRNMPFRGTLTGPRGRLLGVDCDQRPCHVRP